MDNRLARVFDMLACPHCRTPLAEHGPNLLCGDCGAEYPVVDGTPILLLSAVDEKTSQPGAKIRVEEQGLISAAKRLVGVPSPTLETPGLKRSIPNFLRAFPPEARVANIGSADLRYGSGGGSPVLNIDLIHTPGVDVVGDATRLPLRENSLDAIVCRRVLEHVRKPGKAVAEFHRVLKPGGRVWCEIPFLQGYHPTPTDFQRYTRDGLADLFDQYRVVEIGVALGPSSTLSWILREYLAILFSFNQPILYKVNERIFSWLTLPVKLLDYALVRSRFAGQIASSFYLVAEKDAKAAPLA